MPHITRALLRKRAEHNEGLLTTLEELTLHQEELEGINDVLGRTCRELKILYLQNNLLPCLEQLHHLKRLEYLNVALNNICIVEGLGSCEFLRKLDLTMNFVDFDALEASVNHLASLQHLRDLYFLGNPAQTKPWFEGEDEKVRGEGEEEKKQAFFHYVVHRIPQLQFLDGQEITRSVRLVAARHFPKLEARLRVLAVRARREKEEKAAAKRKEQESQPSITTAATAINEGEVTNHDPETRREIYLELAAQKQAKNERQKALAPRERDATQEHAQRVTTIHAEEKQGGRQERRYQERKEENHKVRQKNEGKWTYNLQDEDDESSNSNGNDSTNSHPGSITLNLVLPRHLDSSLIDVDVHPMHINVIVKGKLLRLLLPKEVRVEESKAKRSKTTGDLMIIMPKLEGVIKRRGRHKAATSCLFSAPIHLLSPSSSAGKGSSGNGKGNCSRSNISGNSSGCRRIRGMPRHTLAEEMLAAREEVAYCVRYSSSSDSLSSPRLQPLREAVDVRSIVTRKKEEDESGGGEGGERDKVDCRLLFKELASVRLKKDEEEEEGKEKEKEGSMASRKSSAVQDKEQGDAQDEGWDVYTVPPLI
ncbi:hypothetical protein VYU27_007782 [Nannochloropsis oceanica]